MTIILAAVDNSSAIFRIVLVLATLMACCVLCLVVALWMRKWVKGADAPIQPVGFTLSDLREMHRSGQLTTEEFERAKEKIVVAARRNLTQIKPVRPKVGPIPPVQPNAQDSDRAGDIGL